MSQTQLPSTSSEDIRRFVYEAVRVLVNRPEDIVLEEHADSTTTQIRVIVHPSDFGKLIGQGGKTIQALRVLVAAACSRIHTRYVVEVVDKPRARSGLSDH
jgi:predicted RNA-binding protein YlqC (UPF0109 family)